jgi:hypothetical protein
LREEERLGEVFTQGFPLRGGRVVRVAGRWRGWQGRGFGRVREVVGWRGLRVWTFMGFGVIIKFNKPLGGLEHEAVRFSDTFRSIKLCFCTNWRQPFVFYG